MKYIDTEKLIAEVERLSAEHTSRWETDEVALVLDKLEDFIISLQQEQPEVDLEKEIDNYMDGYFSECQDGTLLNEGGSELQYEDVGKIAKYFYELGRKGGK